MAKPVPSNAVWFITGCSSGFGRRLAKSALSRGDLVVATARKVDNIQIPTSPNLRTLQLDLTAGFDAIKLKVDEAAAIWGRIDVLCNNAGLGLPGLLEEGGSSRLHTQFKTNVYGTFDVTTATVPHMRAQNQGTVVIIGSRSAYKTELPAFGFYCASKAAVHSLGETFAVELAPAGIKVLIVIPGSFRTENIYGQPFETSNRIPGNDAMRAKAENAFTSVAGTEKGDPDKAMEVVVDVVRGEGKATGREWPLYLALGEDSEKDIRAKVGKLVRHVDECGDVIRSVSFDE